MDGSVRRQISIPTLTTHNSVKHVIGIDISEYAGDSKTISGSKYRSMLEFALKSDMT